MLVLADALGAPVGTTGSAALAWLSENGIEVRFDSTIGDSSGTLRVAEGGGKSGVQVADAGSAIAVAWQEIASTGHSIIKLRGVSRDAGALGSEITLGGPGTDLSHHSLFISAYHLDPADASIPEAGAVSGLNLVWVASGADDPAGFGRIMLQRFSVTDADAGTPHLVPFELAAQNGALHRISNNAFADSGLNGAANDNVVWVGNDVGDGAVGRLPTVATLDTGDVLVAWIGAEGHVHGKAYAGPATNGATALDHAALNEALADLTPDYGRDGDAHDARRVKIAELGTGNFVLVWIVAAGADAMLHGALFSLQSGDALAGDGAGQWTQSSITPMPLPQGFTGDFAVSALDTPDQSFALSYEVADAAGSIGTRMVTEKIAVSDVLLDNHQPPSAIDLPASKAHVAPHTASAPASEQHASIDVDTQALPPANPPADSVPDQAIVDAPVTAEAIVTANADGVIVAWMVAGSTPDTVGVRIRLVDGDETADSGKGSSEPITVTDNADPDVAPAVARTGGGGAVAAWVDASSGQLRAQTYTSQGTPQASGGGVTVSSEGHAVSDVSVTSQPSCVTSAEQGAGNPDAGADGNEFAVAWVEDADADGYGSIMLQRYSIPEPSDDPAVDQTPVPLGRDGQAGDGNDAPDHLAIDDGSGPEPVVGRAPQVVDLDQGQLAMSWVENDGSQETVRGAVIERAGGREVLNFDLSEHLHEAATVAKGTRPVLSSSPNGDILVAWLSPDGAGGFDVKAALYRSTGVGTWSLPEDVLELQHFGSQPKNFSATLTTDSGILVSWETSSSGNTQGQYFDLHGDAASDAFRIRGGDSDRASLDSAALPDGRIVVVYAEKDKDGDVDIESHVVKTAGAGLNNQVASTQPAADTSGDHIFGPIDTNAGLGDYGSFSDTLPLASDKDITVAEDATDGVIIDVLEDGSDTGLRVVQINGEDLAIGAPMRLEHGFIQLRTDGDLLFTADEDFHGTVHFAYTVSDEDARLSTASISINVTPVEDDPMPVDLAFEADTETAAPVVVDHSGNGSSQDDDHRGRRGGDRDDDGDASGHRGHGDDDDRAWQGRGSDDHAGRNGDGGRDHAAAADSADSINIASRYARDGDSDRPVERQWLQLDESEDRRGRSDDRSDGDANGHWRFASDSGDGSSHDRDTFVFHAAFGNDATPEIRGLEHVIDLSKSGYPTFQALQDAGALVQVGADVEITLNAADPSHPEKILLRSVELSTLTAHDFKFG